MQIDIPPRPEAFKRHPSAGVGSILGKVTRQGSVVLLTRGAALFLGLATTIIVSRVLGPAGFGQFRLGSVVVQFVTTFCVLGMDKALMRFLPILETRGGGGSRTLLLRSIGVVIAVSLVLSAALLLAAPFLATYYFHSAEMTGVVQMFCFQLPVFALFRFLSGAVTAAKRVDFASKITNILSPAIFLFLLAVTGFVYPGIFGTIAARIVSQLAAVTCLALFLLGRYPNVRGEEAVPLQTFHSYLLLSIPLFFIGLGYQLLNQMDTLMLGHFVSERDVGIYSAAFKVSAFVVIGSEILLPIVAPLFSHLAETHDRHATEVLFQTVTKWLCYSALGIFSLIAIFRVELLTVFGKGFAPGAVILLILGAGQLANAMTGPTGVLLTMTGKQRWEVANTVVMVAVNFLLNLFLIPWMGNIGAALATAISIATINAAKLVQVYFLYDFQAHNLKYLKGIAAIGAAGLASYFLRMFLLDIGCRPYVVVPLAGTAFAVTMVAGFLALGLDEEDKMAMMALRRRDKETV